MWLVDFSISKTQKKCDCLAALCEKHYLECFFDGPGRNPDQQRILKL